MTCHKGGNFDDFLSDGGLLKDCESVSQERVTGYVKSQGSDHDMIKALNLLENQKKLDPEFDRILRNNLWDLHDS
jgi:hypothetical protein